MHGVPVHFFLSLAAANIVVCLLSMSNAQGWPSHNFQHQRQVKNSL